MVIGHLLIKFKEALIPSEKPAVHLAVTSLLVIIGVVEVNHDFMRAILIQLLILLLVYKHMVFQLQTAVLGALMAM